MLVTKEVAEGMFCPLGFANPEGPYIKCQADHCMAWRIYSTVEGDALNDLCYCGLSGKPEV